jgi:3-deoxy-manno-octulosonate cytidylyltransferase (CMP-KDO synthetase)
MIVRVAQQASKAAVDDVVVAVDDAAVFSVVSDAGFTVRMTSPDHQSGSDRVAEVAQEMGCAADDVIINVQGDEPLVPPLVIEHLADAMRADPTVTMATLSEPIESATVYLDPNVVKVATDAHDNALYFSRAPIPFSRDQLALDEIAARRHIGMYAFRYAALQKFVSLPPSRLEQIEKLEQLRWLEAGQKLKVLASPQPVPGGVDTPADLERVAAEFARLSL